MSQRPDDVAVNLGRRVRSGRLRLGRTLADVALDTGVSPATQSRVERGRGSGVSLATWVRLGDAAGEQLFDQREDDLGVYPAALTRLVGRGGWAQVDRVGPTLWFDRPSRAVPGLRNVQRPAERVVIRLVRTLTDVDRDQERLRMDIDSARAAVPPGMACNGTIVVVRSSASVRTAKAHDLGSSHVGWVTALRSVEGRMPLTRGWVWMTPRGTHLLLRAG
jgi:transcriptional regulator with XRE-family HTH domain